MPTRLGARPRHQDRDADGAGCRRQRDAVGTARPSRPPAPKAGLFGDSLRGPDRGVRRCLACALHLALAPLALWRAASRRCLPCTLDARACGATRGPPACVGAAPLASGRRDRSKRAVAASGAVSWAGQRRRTLCLLPHVRRASPFRNLLNENTHTHLQQTTRALREDVGFLLSVSTAPPRRILLSVSSRAQPGTASGRAPRPGVVAAWHSQARTVHSPPPDDSGVGPGASHSERGAGSEYGRTR